MVIQVCSDYWLFVYAFMCNHCLMDCLMWTRLIETDKGATLCTIQRRKDFIFIFLLCVLKDNICQIDRDVLLCAHIQLE